VKYYSVTFALVWKAMNQFRFRYFSEKYIQDFRNYMKLVCPNTISPWMQVHTVGCMVNLVREAWG
jgi:hypothetical protein